MAGLGTVINTAAIILGGLLGLCFGKLIGESLRNGLNMACGVCVLFIGLSGTLEKMLSFNDGKLTSTGSMLLIGCLCIGTLIGEIINIEEGFERFGEWLKIKSGNAKDLRFVDGFVTSSLTVCIGAMAIVGAIQDGLAGDISILVTKAILDFIIILVMTGSMGA